MSRNHTPAGSTGHSLTVCVYSFKISKLMRLFTFLLHCDLSLFKHKPHEPCWLRAAPSFIVILRHMHTSSLFSRQTTQLTQSGQQRFIVTSGQSLKSTFPINAAFLLLSLTVSFSPLPCGNVNINTMFSVSIPPSTTSGNFAGHYLVLCYTVLKADLLSGGGGYWESLEGQLFRAQLRLTWAE